MFKDWLQKNEGRAKYVENFRKSRDNKKAAYEEAERRLADVEASYGPLEPSHDVLTVAACIYRAAQLRELVTSEFAARHGFFVRPLMLSKGLSDAFEFGWIKKVDFMSRIGLGSDYQLLADLAAYWQEQEEKRNAQETLDGERR